MVECVVDFVRAYRDSGAYDQAPTMRASIMLAKILHAGGIALTTDNQILGQIIADVLEAKSGGDHRIRAARQEYLTALARHPFDGAPRPIPPHAVVTNASPAAPVAAPPASDPAALGGHA